jgi:hypothetical protein
MYDTLPNVTGCHAKFGYAGCHVFRLLRWVSLGLMSLCWVSWRSQNGQCNFFSKLIMPILKYEVSVIKNFTFLKHYNTSP